MNYGVYRSRERSLLTTGHPKTYLCRPNVKKKTSGRTGRPPGSVVSAGNGCGKSSRVFAGCLSLKRPRWRTLRRARPQVVWGNAGTHLKLLYRSRLDCEAGRLQLRKDET